MSRSAMPATVADAPHEWEAITCSTCSAVLGQVVSFDAVRVEGAPMHCRACHAWHEIRCTRCALSLGTTATAHHAPVVYCSACAARDAEARARCETRDSQTGGEE